MEMKNKKNLKKLCVILASAVIVIAAVAAFLAFHNRIGDGKAREILSGLIEQSYEINDIVWGKGLPVEENSPQPMSSVSGAQYRAVAKDAGYQTVEELTDAIKEVYSDSFFANTIEYVCFKDVEPLTTDLNGNPDTSTAVYARYTENKGQLYADVMHPSFDTGTRSYDASSARVKKVWFDTVTVELDAVDTATGEKKRETLRLRKQASGWRLDEPTY